MDRIWDAGVDLLVKEIGSELDQDGLISFSPMIAELMDKLLWETGECQDPVEICDYLTSKHGWSTVHAKHVAMLYGVVDAVRTSSRPVDVCWASDVVEKLEAGR